MNEPGQKESDLAINSLLSSDRLILNANENENGSIQEDYTETSSRNFKPQSHIRTHWRLVFVACAVGFCENIMIATVSPFFPQYAKERFEATPTVVGAAISLFPLTTMLTSPFFGLILYRLGRVRTVACGLLLLTFGTLLFGLADALWVFFIARFIQGLGSAAQTVATLALLVDYIDGKGLATAIGLQESAIGVGFMVGPAVGGCLFTALGFKFVFVALACVPFAMFLALPFLIDRNRYKRSISKIQAQEKPNLRALLTRPCIICLIITTTSLGCMGFLEPNLSTHLSLVLGLSELGIGLVFAIPSVVYTVMAFKAGDVAERIGYRITICAGLGQLALCYFLIGPAPWLKFLYQTRVATWIFLLVGLFVLGTGFAMVFVPALPLIKGNFQYLDERNQDVLASLFSSAASAGEFIGPLIGGLLVDFLPQTKEVTCRESEHNESSCLYGMQWASFLFGSLLLLLSPAIVLFVPRPKYLSWDDKAEPLL